MASRLESSDELSALQRAYLRIVELEARLDSAGKAQNHPIALIGMACRFPGGATSPQKYWELLAEGKDAITEIPRDRWNVDALYSVDPQAPGKMYTRWGGFLAGVDQFDPQFFSITPREAVTMDPQQRLLLEVTWEALEHAGVPAEALKGSRTGVFTGTGFNDYARLLSRLDLSQVSAYSGSGIQLCFCTGRVSYVLGLRGPSIPVDTACSSSLVAVHLACQSLRAAECDLALAGGVNLLLAPEGNIFLSKAGALAPDGRCKTFDEAANGFVRGEGCGVVVLKRLEEAMADGDNILAVLAGSAVNHDGRSAGLTVPSGPAQEAVIRQALGNAGIDPVVVSYIEAHGTGTVLGDPIEMQALDAVYGRPERFAQPLLVASVKTNFGHLEAASGVASLIKVVLMMQHRQIPPHLHFKKLNPHIAIDQKIEIPTRLRQWQPRDGGPRVAGISSFGLSGTNAHLIVQEFIVQESQSRPLASDHRSAGSFPVLLPVSARNSEALNALARSYRDYLRDEESAAGALADTCYTAAAGRSHHDQRLAVIANSKAEAATALDHFLQGKQGANLFSGQRPLQGVPKLVFVFSGQGSQRARMGRSLLEEEPTFRATIQQCDALFRDVAGRSLIELLTSEDGSLLAQTEFAQPAIFALQVALASLWCSWGVEPDAVVGHSVGEIAAAHVAGVLALEDAIRLVYHRGRLMQQLTSRGRMAAVGLTPKEGERLLTDYQGKLSIAAVNAPRSIVLSGDSGALGELAKRLKEHNVLCRDLGVDYAFHSHQTEPLERELVEVLSTLQVRPARLPIFSTVTGKSEDGISFNARYWGRNMRQPVLFAQAMASIVDEGFLTFLELSAQPVLQGAIAQCLSYSKVQGVVLSTLNESEPETLALKKSLARLYTNGYAVAWKTLFPQGCRRLSTLPSYPWQRQRCWIDLPEDRAVFDNLPKDDVRGWLYELRWRRQQLHPQPESSSPTAWLILADGQGVGQELRALLEARGHRPVCLARSDVFPLRESSAGEFDQDLLRKALERSLEGHPVWRGVLDLWNLDTTPAAETTASSLMRDQTLAVGTALQVVHTLAARQDTEPARVWLVTRGAQGVGAETEPLAMTQAPVWGLGRTCAAEFPALWGGLIDLDPGSSAAESADHVLQRIFSADLEDQVAFRRGDCYVARVVSVDPPRQKPFLLRSDASYCITGGRSGVGLEIAGWLARKGAKTLVLMGRTKVPPREQWDQVLPPDPRAGLIAQLRELEKLGTTVHLPAIDVTDEKQLRGFLNDYTAKGAPPIKGVFHAASVWRDKEGRSLVLPISHMDQASLQEVFPPKIVGGWLIQQLLGDSLDFIVLFSAGASIVGSAGQGNYSAANAFLDAMALDAARRNGPHTLAINWGPITDVGFGTTPAGKALFAIWQRRGIEGITPPQVLEVLELLIPQKAAQVGVMRTDWDLLKQSYSQLLSRPWASELVRLDSADQPPDLLLVLKAARPDDRKPILVSYLQQQVALVMGLRPEDVPEPHRGLFELGMDSLLALELKNRIQSGLRRDFPATAIFDYSSIDPLADYLLREILPLEKKQLAGPGWDPNSADLVEQIERLSDEEVKLRLGGNSQKAELNNE